LLEAALFALSTAVIWGVGDFLSRKPSSEIGSLLVSVLIQPVGLVLMLILLFSANLQGGITTIFSSSHYFAINIGAGFVAFLGIVFLYRGYAEGIMSIVAPIAGAYPVIAVALSIILLGTTLTLVRALSIAAVIIGIVLSGVKISSFRSSKGEIASPDSNKKLVKGADYGFSAFLCAGLGLFGLGVVAPVIGSILAVVVLKGSENLAALATVLFTKMELKRPRRSTLMWVILIGACDAGGFATYNLAVTSATSDLPIVVTLSSLLGAITVLLARAFYKERLEPIQIVGILIIFASVVAILYF
jgi:drug/metabolite transporter (DMT)-like permease